MITIKSAEEINIMKKAGRILAEILYELGKMAKSGISTDKLEEEVWVLTEKYGVSPSFFNYKPHGYKEVYPAALCVSVNEEVVHVVPSKRVLKEGDIAGLDLGIWIQEKGKRLCVDSAITVAVGEVSKEAFDIINVAKKALNRGIAQIKNKARLGDIGSAIQNYVESKGYSVIRDLSGHAVGYEVHEDPVIPNFGKEGEGIQLKEGMVICVEPMISSGNWEILRTEDGFGYRTADRSLSAHFEHTVAVTKNGFEILTLRG